jgi:hypothetical protein
MIIFTHATAADLPSMPMGKRKNHDLVQLISYKL